MKSDAFSGILFHIIVFRLCARTASSIKLRERERKRKEGEREREGEKETQAQSDRNMAMIFCNQHGFRMHFFLCIIASCFSHSLSLSLQRARERSRKNEITKRESRSAYFFSRRKQQKPPHPRRRRKSQAQKNSNSFDNHGPIASSAGWNHKILMCMFCFIIAFSSRYTKCALSREVSRVWFVVVVSERK